MMSQQVMGSSHLGQSSNNQSFANSQILNQQQLGIFKSSGPVRATAFDYKIEQQYHGMQQQQMMGGRKIGGGVRDGQHKSYKRGQGSLGPSNSNNSNGLRPGTAQKRPASPNAQGL